MAGVAGVKNHSTKDAVWIYILRKASNEAGLKLEEAVDEAVCFGWIDGRMKNCDENRFILRFSQRKPNSVWSRINRSRVERMIKSGRMTEIGLASVEEAKKIGSWDKAYTSRDNPLIPEDLADNHPAMDNFMRLSNSRSSNLLYGLRKLKDLRLEERE